MTNKIVLFNDKPELNYRYRKNLINMLVVNKWETKSIGLKDIVPLICVIFSAQPLLVSNIKANIVSMLFFWTKSVLIINGLGRKRSSKAFRLLLLLLMYINYRKIFCVQRYADYRYFKFKLGGERVYWIPGSGGSKLKKGKEGILAILRESKFPLLYSSLIDFMENSVQPKEIVSIVGMSEPNQIYNKSLLIQFKGWQPDDEIFSHGNEYLQLDGYGEGIPLALCNAVCSHMPIYIQKKLYISLGLNKLGGKVLRLEGNWLKIIPDQKIVENLSHNLISNKIIKIVEDYYSN